MSPRAAAPSAPTREPVTVAVLGAGRLGEALVARLLSRPSPLRLDLVADVVPDSAGLRRAEERGIATSSQGLDAVLRHPSVNLVFDACGAGAHLPHSQALRRAGKVTVDMSPAAIGPVAVPAAGLPQRFDAFEACLVSSIAQAAVPIAAAISRAFKTGYVEAVFTVASSTLGPAARSDLDRLMMQSARALEGIGGASRAKAILIVSPAEPPPPTRCTVYAALDPGFDEPRLRDSIQRTVLEVQGYAPGYRLRRDPALASREMPEGRKTVLEVALEIESSDRPAHAGNLDLMAGAAERVGMRLVNLLPTAREVVA